jgi:hypothetical protein
MYVMSSLPPSQQSIAGGIFNTVNKLCNNLGLGIATSIESSIANRMTASTPAVQPYLSVYWFAAAAAGLSLVMIPFLKLGTQGNAAPESDQNDQLISNEKRSGVGMAAADPADIPIAGVAGSVVSSALEPTETEKR